MAYKDSDELKTDERYPLGDYSLRIERSSVPGSTNDKIEAICTDKDGKNARKSIQVPSSTKLDGWYAEANETEVTVYALIQEPEGDQKTSPLDTSPFPQPIRYLTEIVAISGRYTRIMTGGYFVTYNAINPMVLCGGPPGTVWHYLTYYDGALQSDYENVVGNSFTYDEKSIGVGSTNCPVGTQASQILYPDVPTTSHGNEVMWTAVYGTPSGSHKEPKEIMVGRFAIDIEDAGGVGPGSDWIDPGDYDPEWEEGDPTHTLYVTVTGALSGRHNDPIEDPSYSYIPADKDTVKDYGCGGDGGHGGGGGAGASTVVIHKFATNQANSKEVTAIARRHGYGSGGGKGGKGGDGCILVYYGNGDSPGPGPEPVIQPIVASLSVNKASAAIGEDITWTLSATGGNGNYQYSFTLLDSNNQQVHSTGWQTGLSFSYSLQTEGTYHVIGYVRDSRETDTAQAPQSGTVQVSGSEPTPTPTGNAESQYNIYEISWTGIATSGEGPEPTPTPEGNAQSQYNISELNWSSTITGGEEPGPEPTPTPQADVLSNYEISNLSWTVEVTDTTPSPSPEPEPAPTPDEDVISQFDMSSISWNVTFN